MIFVTHLFFRRQHRGQVLAFRMWGFPVTSLLGAALMAAALVTTYFTAEFRMTLLCGVPFMIALAVVYSVWYRKQAQVAQAVTSS